RLRQVVRDSDTVCRYGGDEFIILIDDLQHEADAENIALKLLALLRQPMEIDGRSLRVDASIGIALAPRDGSTPDQLIGQADRAMYRAKQSGLGIAG
ncbi:MAG TPA: GGDEF domain-containing protein, partial [Chromatiales bacterium]|nr:GGDEF domain-containing protein [Chromatiales bacterium]